MTTQTEITMTGAEAYAKAVEYASMAAGWTAQGIDDKHARNATTLAAISQAFSAIAQLAATEEQTQAIYRANNGSRAY
ncbi:hypothetical protein FKO01_63795 [Mesorhizobium sp. B2-3-3]|nr:hypothetical protein FKO01_63795 [Mesorhizobium sp. B2-3-3]